MTTQAKALPTCADLEAAFSGRGASGSAKTDLIAAARTLRFEVDRLEAEVEALKGESDELSEKCAQHEAHVVLLGEQRDAVYALLREEMWEGGECIRCFGLSPTHKPGCDLDALLSPQERAG